MTDRPDPRVDFQAISDRLRAALADALAQPTEAAALTATDAALADYNNGVDAYNARVEQYNRDHGLSFDDGTAEPMRYLVRNGATAALVAGHAERSTP